MISHTLTEVQYSHDRRGPWKLYIYGKDGYHRGGQWFAKVVQYPDEEIAIPAARALVDQAMDQGQEIRICDGLDFLVMHCANGVQLYPKPPISFWSQIGGEA